MEVNPSFWTVVILLTLFCMLNFLAGIWLGRRSQRHKRQVMLARERNRTQRYKARLRKERKWKEVLREFDRTTRLLRKMEAKEDT